MQGGGAVTHEELGIWSVCIIYLCTSSLLRFLGLQENIQIGWKGVVLFFLSLLLYYATATSCPCQKRIMSTKLGNILRLDISVF